MGKHDWLDDRLAEVTFGEYAERWTSTGPTKRSKTRRRDKGILDKHLLPVLGRTPIRKIKHSDLRVLVSNWIEAGLKSSTIARHKAVMSAIFNLAVADDVINRSPTIGLKIPRIEPGRGTALTAEQANLLLQSIGDDYYPLIYVMLTTGIRWSEAAGLQIRHFKSLDKQPVLVIEQGLHESQNGLEIEPTKSAAGRRTIPLIPDQVAVIARHIRDTGRNGADAHSPLFVSPMGGPLAYSNFRTRVWAPTIKKIGLNGVRISDLRKTAITNMVNAGIDIKTFTSIAGHEDVRTTLKHYAKTTQENLVRASEALVAGISENQHISQTKGA
jgi:integrase